MSGHSKWATIKHQKGAADAKRGKLFSRLSKAIAIAVREGGGDDPNSNPKLRLMVDKARQANMPKENVTRAIDRGAGRIAGASYETLTFEGFGPHKVALIIDCVTDNRNRTNSEIKSLVEKNGGVLGAQGSTAYFFDRKGVITVAVPEDKDTDTIELELIDCGAEDLTLAEDRIRVIVPAAETHRVSEQIKNQGYEVMENEVEMLANTFVELDSKGWDQLQRFVQLIDDHEDVQTIYHNARDQVSST